MKKIIIIVGLIVSTCLLGIGVFGFAQKHLDNKQPSISENENINVFKNRVIKGIGKIKESKQITYTTDVVMEKEEDNASTFMKLNLITKESEIIMSMSGQEIMHSYTVLEDEKLVSYTYSALLGEKWIKVVEDEATFNYDNSYLDIILGEIDSLISLSNDIYQINIPKDKAEGLLNNNQDNGEVTEQLVKDIVVRVVMSNDNLEKIQFDFSNAIETQDGVITKYIMTNSYQDVDTTIISVPEEVKNNAVNSEDLIG